MINKQKNSINITPDDELLELIDKEAKDNMRTRKAQVEYIIKQYFKDSKEKLIFKEWKTREKMIIVNLILAVSMIGIIYRIKPFDNTQTWVSISIVIALFLNGLNSIDLENRKVEALEKLVVEISKSKVEEVKWESLQSNK